MSVLPRPSRTQAEKAEAFHALHRGSECFLIPNPYDAGTARLLEHLGFKALATTSSGLAATLGRLDNTLSRDQVIEHMAEVAAATDLPVNGDLEDGFGPSPEAAAETIRLGAMAGLAGGSIEDSTRGDADHTVYEIAHAVERVHAAAEAAHSLPVPFLLTARAENFIAGRPDLADTIHRLQAYQDAGADVLYAPGLVRREDIAEVVRSVDRPVNVLAGIRGMDLDLAALSALGVRRVSTGGALTWAALGGFVRAAREMIERGTFTFVAEGVRRQDLMGAFGAED